jgi:hypothetical protein
MKWNLTHLAYCWRLSELTRLRSEHVGMLFDKANDN